VIEIWKSAIIDRSAFVAPEVLGFEDYNYSADHWKETALKEQIQKFNIPQIHHLDSLDLQNLVNKMLQPNKKQRIIIDQIFVIGIVSKFEFKTEQEIIEETKEFQLAES
jgi:serine/threonine protein kinase